MAWSFHSAKNSKQPSRTARRSLPRLEQLEDRLAPAAIDPIADQTVVKGDTLTLVPTGTHLQQLL